jgi:uroporphyrin-III C-methyltransferase/precorrin-2 dehydrogenase/sirohydrochlorin ferrochelatase
MSGSAAARPTRSLRRALTGYPIELDVTGRLTVVVGGGRVATRRARALVDAGATVTVVAPEVDAAIADLPVTLRRRRYRDGDLAGAWLAHAATDDPAVNAAVAGEAQRRRIWCVRADDKTKTAARVPAVARHGDVTVAVTSGDPRRSKRIASERVSPEPAFAPGSVALVGGGPGDPGLITVRGRRLLALADVVVADRLGPRDLLAHLGPDVEIIDVGKAPGLHAVSQEQINALLVERALAGKRVVRLKGGDPFVFGRGGEEAMACARAGVPVQVVPGLTSATAVPAVAGIPVTHRGVTQDFAVVSAHVDPSGPGATVDWAALANGPGTLVLLMAVAHLEAIADELIKRGRDAATPVAVISNGSLPEQRVLISTLKRVAADARRANVAPPSVVVIGDVVRLREKIA